MHVQRAKPRVVSSCTSSACSRSHAPSWPSLTKSHDGQSSHCKNHFERVCTRSRMACPCRSRSKHGGILISAIITNSTQPAEEKAHASSAFMRGSNDLRKALNVPACFEFFPAHGIWRLSTLPVKTLAKATCTWAAPVKKWHTLRLESPKPH